MTEAEIMEFIQTIGYVFECVDMSISHIKERIAAGKAKRHDVVEWLDITTENLQNGQELLDSLRNALYNNELDVPSLLHRIDCMQDCLNDYRVDVAAIRASVGCKA